MTRLYTYSDSQADNMETRKKFVEMMREDPTTFHKLQRRLISLKKRGRKAERALTSKRITWKQYTEHVEALRAFALDMSKTRGWPKLPTQGV